MRLLSANICQLPISTAEAKGSVAIFYHKPKYWHLFIWWCHQTKSQRISRYNYSSLCWTWSYPTVFETFHSKMTTCWWRSSKSQATIIWELWMSKSIKQLCYWKNDIWPAGALTSRVNKFNIIYPWGSSISKPNFLAKFKSAGFIFWLAMSDWWKFHGYPSTSCWDISVWTEEVDWQTNPAIITAMPLTCI